MSQKKRILRTASLKNQVLVVDLEEVSSLQLSFSCL